jgi:hypothetical protein
MSKSSLPIAKRATLRAGDVFLKIDTDQTRTDVEVAAMAIAPIPTPEVLWRSGIRRSPRSMRCSARERGLFHIICYLREGDRVYETYWTKRRGAEVMDNSYALLDLTVFGRQEAWEDSPAGWPKRGHTSRSDRGEPDWSRTSQWPGGRPTAQWSRLAAGRSDDLGLALSSTSPRRPTMPGTDIERDLGEAASEFIASHQQADDAIRAAVDAGMPGEAIARVSGLSRPTVDAFLAQIVNTSKSAQQ